MKTNILKKILAVLVSFAMLLCAVPAQFVSFAEETPADIVIANGDNQVALGQTSISSDYVKNGEYALKATNHTDGYFATQYMWSTAERYGSVDISSIIGDSQSGALRFWLYVEDITTLEEFKLYPGSSYVRFGTKGRDAEGNVISNPDKARFYNWKNWVDQITKSGWNEIVLKFSDSGISGESTYSIDHTKMDYFVISFANLATQTTVYLDDIVISANTEYTPAPADVVIVDDENGEQLGLANTSTEQAKVGTKSLCSKTNNTAIAYAGFWGGAAFDPVKNIAAVTCNGTDGALRFWFYVEDIASIKPMKKLSSTSYVKIGSGKNPDNNLYIWSSWLDQVTQSGWNEIVLNFTDIKDKTGTPNLEAIDTIYFKFPEGTPQVTVYLDDIRVSANTLHSDSVNLPVFVSSGAKAAAGNKTLEKNGFSVDASKVVDPYLKLEIYIARGDDASATVNGVFGFNQVEISSSGTYDSNELQWKWSSGLKLEPGWNVRYLPLSLATETGEFDITNINYFRFIQNANGSSTTFQIKVKNASIIPHCDVPEYNLAIDSTKTGTGTLNVSKKMSATEGISSFDASNLKNPHLQFSLYIARQDDPTSITGVIRGGQIELTSSGKSDNSEIAFGMSKLDIKAGWNTFCIPFAMMSPTDGNTGAFDITKINYFRVYNSVNDSSVSYTLQVKDVKIVSKDIEFSLDSIYGNYMLFQQNKDVVISGNGGPLTTYDVSLVTQDGTSLQTVQTTVDSEGRFSVTLDGREGGYTEYDVIFAAGGETVYTIEDVVFGELWLASGQSNMALSMSQDIDGKEIVSNPTDKYIRMLIVPVYSSSDYPYLPLEAVSNAYWGNGTQSGVIGQCSAVGYYHAAELREQLDMPIGIIDANYGGTSIYAWLSREAIEGNDTVLANAKADGYYISESAWNTASSQHLQMSAMYNTKIAPLDNLSIAGMIWYQGCANVDDPTGHYSAALELLLESYSESFGFENSTMPVIVSHLHPYDFANRNGAKFNNELSAFVANHPDNAAQIAIYDLPVEYDGNIPIHPTKKQGIGTRMGLAAAGLVYDKNDTVTSPSFESATAENGAMIVKFKNLGSSSLAAKNGNALDGFAIAGADGVYMPAKAEIVSADTVKVWNISVTNPTAVTYAYTAVNNTANLVSVDANGEVLFAVVPFCSDVRDDDTLYRPVAWLSTEALTYWRSSGNTDIAGWHNIWSTDSEATTVALDTANKTDGASSLKISYTANSFSIAPNTTYYHETSLTKYGRLIFDIKTANELTLNITADKTYTIKASDKWQRFTVDLSGIDAMSDFAFTFASDSDSGEVYIDNLSLLAVASDGDVNNDTEVNGTDLVMLRQLLLGSIAEIGISDVNKDGYTNIIDLVRLKKMLVS